MTRTRTIVRRTSRQPLRFKRPAALAAFHALERGETKETPRWPRGRRYGPSSFQPLSLESALGPSARPDRRGQLGGDRLQQAAVSLAEGADQVAIHVDLAVDLAALLDRNNDLRPGIEEAL